MSSLGLYLRGLREAKGMSLDDIARSTRVGRRHLEALETDTFGELPAPVFVKGFIHAYCEFLDSSSEEALGLYRETIGEPAAPHGPLRPLLAPHAAGGAAHDQHHPLRRPGGQPLRPPSRAPVFAQGHRIGAGTRRSAETHHARPGLEPCHERYGCVHFAVDCPNARASARPRSSRRTRAGPELGGSRQRRLCPRPPPPASSATGEAKPGSHHLIVRAVEPTWLRVQVDDGQVAEELLQAGAVREWTATRRFTLTVGNAGGVEIDLNGKRMPSLGAKGAVIQRLVLPQESAGTGS